MGSSDQLFEPLTRRENDILALLGQNLTDREIAERLVLSVNSVKWYTRQVYGKLGVTGRREAVAKARELSLLAGREAPLKKLSHNLPRRLSSFIGREKDIERVAEMIWEYPLVTLTGAGGVGKTRLAFVVAEELLDDFANGVWCVELASLSDPLLLAQTIAGRIGIYQGGRTALESLLSYFQGRQALLLLDNCEHLAQACAELALALLSALPGLKVLATSREPLGINGEAVFRVPSLNCPADQAGQTLETCLGYEAVRLFVERARAALPGFQLTPANAAQVEQIVRRLDGIPLAIELAAARARMMGVEEIAARLDHAFGLLTGGSRAELPRHQTLRALIDWSYQLLTPQLQLLLQRLSVFAGGWTLEAAEQVCSDPQPAESPDASAAGQVGSHPQLAESPDAEDAGQVGLVGGAPVIELLGRLVDKSLVQFEPAAGGEARYHLLETVRQYAAERLAAGGGQAALRERHLDYYTVLALQAAPHLRGWQSKAWLERLERELANLRQALECSASGSIEQGLHLAAATWWFWMLRNHHVEGAAWLERLLLAQNDRGDPKTLDLDGRVARGRALNVLSQFIGGVRMGGSPPLHMRLIKEDLDAESLAIFQPLCVELGAAYRGDLALSLINGPMANLQAVLEIREPMANLQALLEIREMFLSVGDLFWASETDLGLFWECQDDYEKAFFYAEENLAWKREIGDVDGEGGALYSLGFIELCSANLERGIELYKAAIACLEDAGDQEWVAVYQCFLAAIYIEQGDYLEAARLLQSIQTAAMAMDHLAIQHRILFLQGYLAWAQRQYDRAVRCCEASMAFSGANFISLPKILNLIILTRVAMLRGDLPAARAYLRRLFSYLDWYEYNWVYAFHALAIFAALQGQVQRSATWVGVRDRLIAQYGLPRYGFFLTEVSQAGEALASARAALGEEAYAAAVQAGRAMTIAQALEYSRAYLEESPDADRGPG